MGWLPLPVYRGFNFKISSQDVFLTNPPAGFKKNSFQLTTDLTYALPEAPERDQRVGGARKDGGSGQFPS